jgi:hypothetical protein
MRRLVGPYQIIERRGQFQLRKGRTILSTHSHYLIAEDEALRRWLGPQDHEDFDNADFPDHGATSGY